MPARTDEQMQAAVDAMIAEMALERPKTPAAWRALEARYRGAVVAREAFAVANIEAWGGEEGECVYERFDDEERALHFWVLTSPAVDRQSISFKLATYEPGLWCEDAVWDLLHDDLQHWLSVLNGRIVTVFAPYPEAQAEEGRA